VAQFRRRCERKGPALIEALCDTEKERSPNGRGSESTSKHHSEPRPLGSGCRGINAKFTYLNMARRRRNHLPVNRMMAAFASDFRDGVDRQPGIGYVNEKTIPVACLTEAIEAVASDGVKYRQAFQLWRAGGIGEFGGISAAVPDVG